MAHVAFWSVLAAVLCSLPLGCSRAFWRDQADRDSYRIIERKMTDPRWVLPRVGITPDQRSRFFDPYDPDKPPLPPDDPAAHFYMHQVHGYKGYKNWCKLGIASSIENPQWLEPFGLTPEMTVLRENNYTAVPLPYIENLTLVDAVELSNIHSRDLQTELENNYLTALALTFERFRFAVRYLGFGGAEPGGDLEFESIPGVENSLDLDTDFGISQLLPTGGQWIVELANSTLWLFDNNGPDGSTTFSTLSYSLVQPLLRGAGRKVVLESLTQSERNALYAVRDLARFRRLFFTDVAAAYLALLEQSQTVVNERSNVFRFEEQLEIQRAFAARRPTRISEALEQLPAGLVFPPELAEQIEYSEVDRRLYWQGAMTAEQEQLILGLSQDEAYQNAAREIVQNLQSDTTNLDVLQLESQYTDSQNRLRSQETTLQILLDSFKLLLGLPPDMEVTIDESLLEQFQLIDPELSAVEQRVKDYIEQLRGIEFDEPDIDILRSVAAGLPELANDVRDNTLARIQADFLKVEAQLPDRLARLETEEARRRVLRDVDRDRRLYQGIERDFRDILDRLAELTATLESDAVGAASEIAEIREELLKISQSAQVIQIGLRVELISLQEFTLGREEAVDFALENRLDLKNSLGTVTDFRRRVEVEANRLQKVVDIRTEGDIRTPVGDNPLDFRGVESSFRTGISFTAPLDQIDERNSFRTAVINYQRARRDYMALEDGIKLAVRNSWRRLELGNQNFETARQSIRISALQFDSSVEDAANPVQQQGARAQSSSLNLLNALNQVLQSQNQLIRIWIAYEQERLNIFRDMGIMEIDARGLWVDDVYQDLAKQQDENTKSGRSDDEVVFVTDAAEGTLDEFDRAAARQVVGNDDDGSRLLEGEWFLPIEEPLEAGTEEEPPDVGRDAGAVGAGAVLDDGWFQPVDADQRP